MVENNDFDPNVYVSSPFTAPEERVRPTVDSTAVDGAGDAGVVEPATPVDGTAETAEDSKPPFEPIVLDNPMQLVFRPPAAQYIPVRSARSMEDEGPSVRRRTRGNRAERSERVERVYIEPEQITEPQRVRGSTRIEAKRQRRRDSRETGRRRPVVTETEFLARRESVDRTMVVRTKDGRIQIGVLEDNVLVEHYVARSTESSIIGNVYIGKVQNVLPSMEAAFVDIGRGRNAVLYSGEVDWDAAATDENANQPRRIEMALKSGDQVLVQVTKDPVGHKGARLTSQVSLPGRYVVYVPSGSINGISRKLPDSERTRLKKIL